MGNAVLQSVSYVLAHTPDMVIHNGTTQTTERIVNPHSEYLQKINGHLRSYEQTLPYAPHQTYIGNMTPDELKSTPFPWHEQPASVTSENLRFGRFGEIMPEDEFIGLMQIADAFDLVKLTEPFAENVKVKFENHPLLKRYASAIKTGLPEEEINRLIREAHAEILAVNGQTVGCVKRAHDIDPNLSAHVMFENLASKASAALALMHLVKETDASEIEYVIECSEEACGDMNQRGGGNFAKATAEIAGLTNATGSDTRGFCAAPVHALIEAASLVKAGTFKKVAVVAGGATAKLGMNGKDHVKKGLPVLEDVLGGFAALVGEDDGVNPVVNTSCVGRHTVGSGSAPQAVITALTAAPLEKAGLHITDVDKFAAELQNPDITKPAGAGDVPEANYKMIAALSVMRKEIERSDIPAFIEKHGMPGFAPTQGHIPSGVPFLGFAREGLTAGELNRVMIIGKGSLFLGRMTNLFDGISVLLERNKGISEQAAEAARSLCAGITITPARRIYRIGLTTDGSEHGAAALIEGARLALKQNDTLEVVFIGEKPSDPLPDRSAWIDTPEYDAHTVMEKMLDDGQLDACVTMHYSFPIGVSTVGKAVTPGLGREMLVATTTGTASPHRVEAMVKNALYGIAAAKASGIENPTVGILNVDGAVKTENALKKLCDGGYAIRFSESVRSDGGSLMRGNDLLRGGADVMVTDSLTGNVLIKMLSSFTTGGTYESMGSGYGPGLGEGYRRLILILSRASGAPVAANALLHAVELAKGGVINRVEEELKAARKAGLDDILAGLRQSPLPAEDTPHAGTPSVSVLPKEVVTAEIPSIDILLLEDAVSLLMKNGIYAESGMGCTGPVVLVSDANREKARDILGSLLS